MSINTTDVFKDRLKEVRQSLGLTQAQMAKLMKVSRATVGFYENGERLPDISVLYTLALQTGVSPGYYMGLSGSKKIEYEEASAITGLDDEAIDALTAAAQDDTSVVNNLVKHPDFINMVKGLSILSSIASHDPKSSTQPPDLDMARAMIHVFMEHIITDSININI